MLTENLSSQQAGAGSANTSSIKEQVLESLKSSAEYRHAFIEEAIRSRLTAQINALRVAEGWDYKAFANRLGKKLSWAYRLEDPNATAPTIPTLLEVAEVFDIALDVRFRRFSELLEDTVTLTPESFHVPSFTSEEQARAFTKRTRRRRAADKGLRVIKGRRRREGTKRGPTMETSHSILDDFGQQARKGNYGIQEG